ncbi:hypothetical protein TcWFU_009203 [Taenia crassiceps]|uniref:Fork-head domain-containing protein n=1 Tax=Taenia crassiceps TaxID=6207 RepID=A0ABR4QTK0_9CEST
MGADINPVLSALSPICSRGRFIKGVASSDPAVLIDNFEPPKTFQNGDHSVLFPFEQDKALSEESLFPTVKIQPWTRGIFNAIPYHPITKIKPTSYEEPPAWRLGKGSCTSPSLFRSSSEHQTQPLDTYEGSPMGVTTPLRKSSSTLREEKYFKIRSGRCSTDASPHVNPVLKGSVPYKRPRVCETSPPPGCVTRLLRSLEAWKDPAQAPSSKEQAKLNSFACERRRRQKHAILRLWLEAAQRMLISSTFYRLKLMHHMFCAMRAFAIVARKRQAVAVTLAAEAGEMKMIGCAAAHDRRRLLRRVLRAWVRRARGLRLALHQQRVATFYSQRSLLHRTLRAWLDFCACRTSIHIAVAYFEATKDTRLCRAALRHWRSVVGRQKRMYECYYSVCALHQRHLLGRVLSRWHHHTHVKATATRIAEAMARRSHKRLLRKVFVRWRSMKLELRRERLELEMAVKQHWRRAAGPFLRIVFQRWRNEMRTSQRYEFSAQASQRRILTSALRTWHLRLIEARERSILLRQAYCFRNMHLRVYYFTRWVEAQKEVQRVRSLDKVALWHWALTLQARTWRAWTVYLTAVRAVHIRRQRAFQRFSERLAKYAIALWLGAVFSVQQTAPDGESPWNKGVLRFSYLWYGAIPLEKRAPRPLKKFEPLDAEDVGYKGIQSTGLSDFVIPNTSGNFKSSKSSSRLQPKVPGFLLDTLQMRGVSNVESYNICKEDDYMDISLLKQLGTERRAPGEFSSSRVKEFTDARGEHSGNHLAIVTASCGKACGFCRVTVLREIGARIASLLSVEAANTSNNLAEEVDYELERARRDQSDVQCQKGDIIKITPLDNEEEFMRDERYSTVNILENRQAYKIHEPSNTFPNSAASTFSISTNPTSMHSSYFGSHYSNTYGENLAKPLYSYTHLIFMAIESTPTKCMTVNQIYNWCETNFPFFKHSATGWKNSLRHNLSINKSFKRLPRDGRGPGRGAFWAIEPRERPNLLDAVKRNPFTLGISRERSVVRPITINPIQPFSAINSDISRANFTEFTGECATKPNGASNLIISNGLDGSGSFSLVDAGDNLVNKRTVAPYQSTPLENLKLNSSAQMTHSYLPLAISEAESPVSQEAVQSSAYAFEPWPAEEEEKYQEMMRLLLEGHNAEASRDSVVGDGTSIPNGNGIDTPTKPKKETKQRRKSSLNPTNENMCDRCKENAASTCRSCSLRMWNLHHTASSMSTISTPIDAARVLSHVNKPGNYGVNSALDQLLDALDEDQEAPPPHWHKQVQPAGEVYITPAPYLDHEYCHCQKHIRPIAETCIIDAVNSRLRQEKLNLLRGLVDPRAGLSFDADSMSMEPVEIDFVHSTKSSGGAEKGDYGDSSPPAYLRQTKRHTRQIKGISGSRKRRAKGGGTYAPMPKIGKRPSVYNRALKRSYDELTIEDRAELGYADDNDFYIDNDYYDPPPYTGHYQRRIHFNSKNNEEFSRFDVEAEMHKRRFKRQFPYSPRVICATSSRMSGGRLGTPFSKSFSTTRKRRLAELADSQHEQQRLRQMNTANETSKVADLLANGTKDVKSESEHSSTQAAKIMMGISQMKNFKAKPDLVSMRSSRSSDDSLVASSVST